MDHHPAGPHPVRCSTGRQHIAIIFLNVLLAGVGQIDEVGCVEGQLDPCCPGGLPQLEGGLLPDPDPLATLVLVAVQAKICNPPGGVQRGFMDLGKAVAVARRAEFRAHRKGFLLPISRKGVSMA